MNKNLESMASELKTAADELKKAAKHCRISASHFIEKEVPRGGAHAFAAMGNISKANTIIRQRSEFHSERASTVEVKP